ncbi:RHS repeat-associated core domain-containing protein [Luteibacter mycovicinus]|uniref:RHS repeat-associated core domain-containing protein n=2 Tax=Luteibacter TaxID=242605 RepID=UPI0018CE8012|nr:RHS repeat-associated core domain-containing protein [Luteibacter sp. 9143a]
MCGLIAQWGLAMPSYALSDTNDFGPPYAFYSQIPDAKQYSSLDQMIKVASTYLAGQGATAGCYLYVQNLNPHQNFQNFILEMQYRDNVTPTSCAGNNLPLAVNVTFRSYDVGKNAGGCDCDSGNGHDGSPLRSTPLEADPINTATGNKFLQETDYRGGLQVLTFRRFYNSLSGMTSTTLGSLWRHSFDRSLRSLSTTTINLYRPDGRVEQFVKTNGIWAPDADVADTLTEQDDASGTAIGYSVFLAAVRETEAYSASGLLQSITPLSGAPTTFNYSVPSTPASVAPAPDLLISAVAPDGRALHFFYDGSSRLTQVTLPDGALLKYSYDASTGDLIGVQYPDGKTRQYLYNETDLTGGKNLPGLLTGILDETGKRFESTTYDSSSRALSSSRAGGVNALTVTYGTSTSLPTVSTVTTALGTKTNLGFKNILGTLKVSGSSQPCGGGCNQPWQARTYDTRGYPASAKDFNGAVTTTTYDAQGLLTRQVEAAGTDAQRNTSMTWETVHRVPLTQAVSNADGNVVSKQAWAYNARGQVTAECAIDPSVTVTYACGSQAHAPKGIRQVKYTYCDATDATQCPRVGLLLTVDGARTDITDLTRFSYFLTSDESGCAALGGACHRAGDPATITDAAGLVTSYLSYDKAGRLARAKSADGVITDYSYTPRGQLATTVVRALSTGVASGADATTHIAYTPDGAVRTVTDPDGIVTTYAYDDAHRLTDITDGLGRRMHYTLDAAGNATKAQSITAAGTVVKSTSRSFNTLGQLTAIIDGLGRAVFSATDSDSYDGNGNLVHSRDALGIQQKQVFDGLNRLVSTLQNYQGTDTATRDSQSVSTYDAIDRVTGFSDPGGLNTYYDRDGLGNVTGLRSPDTGTTSNTFDVAGNRLTSTDATGNARAMTYDALGRPLTVTFADSSKSIQYKYDDADTATGCTGSHGKGHMTRIIEANGGIVWCYDGRGNVLMKQQAVGAATTTTAYTWTPANRLKSITTANGTLIAYTRDGDGSIITVTATPKGGVATTIASSVVYKSFGPIASLKLGDGQVVTYSYDATGALTDIVSTAFTLHMKRDAMGNLTAIGNAAGVATPTETYGYDSLYRLTGVTGSSGNAIEAYTYNKTGDRLSKTAPGLLTGTYSFASGTHQLTGIGTTTRTVDARGNTTSSHLASGTDVYGYDQRNRLTSVTRDGTVVGSYVLNALDQRVQKTAKGSTTRFDYDEGSQLLSESSGTAARDYIWLGTLPVGVVDVSGSSTSVAFVHADGLGTPRSVTNASGTVLWQWPYASNPFGEKAPTSAVGYGLNLRFPGQYFDAESGLNYNLNRDYEATTGRYVQSDPIGLNAGSSTYAYTLNDPLAMVDPNGHDAIVLIDPSAAMIFGRTAGHEAILVGSDKSGWSYYSKQGRRDGVQYDVMRNYNKLSDFESTWGSDYPMQYGVPTTSEADATMNDWARKNIGRPYNALRFNCGDFVNGVLKAGGQHPYENHLLPTIPNKMLNNLGSLGDDVYYPGPDYYPSEKLQTRMWGEP